MAVEGGTACSVPGRVYILSVGKKAGKIPVLIWLLKVFMLNFKCTK